ncbi:protein of unknown function [Taphrina deformans PYCC 5710]|uniref:Transcription factor domain-containing protein n=1 Tax=Taphrina deformans (strain PYCC 5710 / ATCC 11124 / CBS 356.35 / IMI 108563 / JCM 9778 / NBRC 8474) TaxID=1097556 RepID=R4XCQ4_TAPDE|nr:protein of unknown function [Taphrina deformans PYCC 5710]|eukprot:CCG82166.1 protein of unknown function [Taphrina deformans PYCC 5710]
MVVELESVLTVAAYRFSDLESERVTREGHDYVVLPSPGKLRSWRVDAEQVLQYYIYHSKQNDVNYFFDRYNAADWRLTELVPMVTKVNLMGDVVLDLMVALHQLRNSSKRHLIHYDRALRNFGQVLQRPERGTCDWLSLLACIVLLAQYDVNTRRGRDLAIHLRAAANLLKLHEHEDVAPALRNKRRTLTRVTMTYDLQHNLVSGDDLHLPLSSYELMLRTARPIESNGEVRTSLDQLWSTTNYLWAKFAVMTESAEISDESIVTISKGLVDILAGCRKYWREVEIDSPLHAPSPFGLTIIYRAPAYRLVGITLHTLALMLCSWSGTAHKYFDRIKYRNHIFRAHAPLFPWDSRDRRPKDSGKYVHHAFPSILHLTLAASEVGPHEELQQAWVQSIMSKAKEHGYTLGNTLLQILQSRSTSGFGTWDDIGCKAFLTTCRYLRQSGLA